MILTYSSERRSYLVDDRRPLAACYVQKHIKYLESRLKAVKARNEYILCLEAANAAMQKYFNDDMHDLINVISLLGLIVFIRCLIIASFFSVPVWLEQLIQSVELTYYLTAFSPLALIAVHRFGIRKGIQHVKCHCSSPERFSLEDLWRTLVSLGAKLLAMITMDNTGLG